MAGKENRSDGPLTASVEKLRGELDHWLEVAMTQGGKALNAFGFRNADKPWNPAVDMVETPDDVFVDVSLPGADPGSIEVTIAGNLLTIKGETPDLQIGSDDARLNDGHKIVFVNFPNAAHPRGAKHNSAAHRHATANVAIARAARGDGNLMPMGKPQNGANAFGTAREGHGFGCAGDKPFVAGMRGECGLVEAQFSGSKLALEALPEFRVHPI